ncbi:MAG: S53 family peptidase [Candidatus Dormiibacterota bacterium]
MKTQWIAVGSLLVASFAGGATARAAASAAPSVTHACGVAPPGAARCFADVVTQRPIAHSTTTIAGYVASQLESAYRLPVSRGAGQTIAVVDAFDDPTAEADLATYRSTNGLAPCTTSNGCFRKLNETGTAGPYPSADPGWGIEISLDLDMVSAACPLCHIVLVEASSSLVLDLGIAEDTAAGLGVAAISNSYGLAEFNGMQQFEKYYRHPGTTILVSSGDFGFGAANFPAVMSNVVAVGGTTLSPASNARGWSEIAWNGAGSGCSAYIAKPSWQPGNHCFMRTVADVSADADPNPGLAVYDTSFPPGFDGLNPGWIGVGGTSASSPFIAGVVGLAGNGKTMSPGYAYHHVGGFFDVIGGSNGSCGSLQNYLCNGVKGYDAPTGIGTPNGAKGL